MHTLFRIVPCLLLLRVGAAPAQEIRLSPGALSGDSTLAAAIPQAAQHAIAIYREADREKYLDNLFRLELAAERYHDAGKTMIELRDLRIAHHHETAAAATLPYQVYARASAVRPVSSPKFDETLRQAFREIVGGVDDRTAAVQVPWVFGTSLSRIENTLRETVERNRGKELLPIADAVDLIRKYLAARAYRAFDGVTAALLEEDIRRRYYIDPNLLVKTPDGASICVLVVRQRGNASRLPALLNFTIYADSSQNMFEAIRTASNGFVGVEALTRGKGCSPDKAVPIEHDGSDARAVIDWIIRQPWSDGRVGMFGGSYEGFTQWAAAKRLPKALKAMMPSVTFAPGIDFPMDGNVFVNYAYPWPFYTTNVKRLDNATYGDSTRWARLNRDWYTSGRAYRDMDKIDGTPNPVFNRWVEHPSYDAYWQAAIPYEKEFARIDIPVLTTTGYYDGGQMGALYYFTQHNRYLPSANHYLVVGPYGHISGQRGTVSPLGSTLNTLRGYELDSAAHLDVGELRYQWFNFVFKGQPRPAILKDKVNYEVMGANVWRHAPTLDAMSGDPLRLYLTSLKSGDRNRLSRTKPDDQAFIAQRVDLADRSAVDRMASGDIPDQAQDEHQIVTKTLTPWNGIAFVSDAFTRATEVSGLFSGRLDFVTNKRDFDFSLTLYELSSHGQYMELSYHWARASYVADRSHRRLLIPGKRQTVGFKSGRLTSRLLQPGSRIVAVLAIINHSGEQINYGTGKEVSDETIADAGLPLEIRWYGTSFVDVPVRK